MPVGGDQRFRIAPREASMAIFVVNSLGEKEFVTELLKQLESYGIHNRNDDRVPCPDISSLDKSDSELDDSSVLIVLVSHWSDPWMWCGTKLDAEFLSELEAMRILVLPVVPETCDIPESLRNMPFADFTKSFEEGLQTIVSGAVNATSPRLTIHRTHVHHFNSSTNWSDTGESITLRLSCLEQWPESPFCILTTAAIHIPYNETRLFKAQLAKDKGEQYRMFTLKSVLDYLDSSDRYGGECALSCYNQYEYAMNFDECHAVNPYRIEINCKVIGHSSARRAGMIVCYNWHFALKTAVEQLGHISGGFAQ